MQNKPEPAFLGQYFETLLPTATACLALPKPCHWPESRKTAKNGGQDTPRIVNEVGDSSTRLWQEVASSPTRRVTK
jgi:hypothetical protein